MASYLDSNGLLYVYQDLLSRFNSKQNTLTIDTGISSTSTDSNVPSSKAVYTYVTNALSGITEFSAEIVQTLPTTGQKTNVIYLVPKSSGGEQDGYDEYMWINSQWELIGTTDIDLSVASTTQDGLMSSTDKAKLDGIAEGANSYVHPTSAGNKHIPSGGSAGQILRWSSSGTAAWGDDNNTTYSVFTGATASAAGTTGLVPAPAASNQGKFLKGDGTWAEPVVLTNAEIDQIIALATQQGG